ncbi:NAD(P)H-dependent flavin oxidoreductase [Endozoicomonas arenosclerae]|uniref:NAD(P)H-dependent flavin oxidoreductase n=1 Tax=Endozoicomonas arenosclerae TaxID=1633495 RepID=UPI0007854A62|nr:nitronate monooxygenase family protein [Endozoicomonas arenosclerae]
MALHASLKDSLVLPVIGSPMFIVSGPELVIAQCKAGIVGSFPALNARPQEELDVWLTRINSELEAHKAEFPDSKVAPYAVNLVIQPGNPRMEADIATIIRHKVPVIITSLRAPDPAMIEAVHAYGGIVLHDVINVRHARKAHQHGVDGLILVCAGAGGHGGTLNPFALVNEVKSFFDGMIILAGSIATGSDILAVQSMGADLAYMGSSFIATPEANAPDDYREMLVDGNANDIVYTPVFTGIHGNYLKPSISKSGMDPDNLPEPSQEIFNFAGSDARAWKDIWGAGQGIGSVKKVQPVAELVSQLSSEYKAAVEHLQTVLFESE